MYPVLVNIGPFVIYSYGLFLALAYLAATFIFWREGKKRGFKEEKLIDFSVLTLITALIGGRIFYALFNQSVFTDNWGKIFAVWEGGFSYWGSLLFVFIVGSYLVRLWRWDFFQIADIAALSALLAVFFGKIGSFLAGNDYGSLTTLPWGVKLVFLEGSRHPVQLYEAFFSLILFIFLFRLYQKNLTRLADLRSGSIFFYFLFLTSFGRLIFEQFRGDSTFWGPFSVASVISLTLAIVSFFSLYYYQFRNFRADLHTISRYFLGVNIKIKNPFQKGN